MKHKTLSSFVTLMSLLTVPALAETVKIETATHPVEIENVMQIPFSEFDVNQDGFYSKTEVGKKLFDVFDRDGNQLIDNNEWEMNSLYTIIPMEKEIYKFVDENDDGYVERSSYTYQTFFQESGLIHFDENRDGLSPKDFIETGFQNLDDNDDNLINLEEWEEAYQIKISPEAAEQERYN